MAREWLRIRSAVRSFYIAFSWDSCRSNDVTLKSSQNRGVWTGASLNGGGIRLAFFDAARNGSGTAERHDVD